MKLSNTAYDIIKWLSLVFFDAVGVLYKTLASVWGLPFGEEVLTTCAAIALFLGALIGVSAAQYYKGPRVKDLTADYIKPTPTELPDLPYRPEMPGPIPVPEDPTAGKEM